MLDRLKKLPRLVQILIAFVLVIGAIAFLGALMRPAPEVQVTGSEPDPAPESASNLEEVELADSPGPAPRPGPRPGPADSATEAAPAVSHVRQERRRPAAFPSDHPMQPGGVETYYTNPSGRGWHRIGEKRLESGMPLVSIDTQAVGNSGVRGWSASVSRRVSRSGLFLVEQEGEHTFILDGTVPGWQFGLAHRQACEVAVGDDGSMILRGQGGATGSAALAAGWHWVYFTCEPAHQDLVADVAVVGPTAGSADLIALFMPQDQEDDDAAPDSSATDPNAQAGDDAAAMEGGA